MRKHLWIIFCLLLFPFVLVHAQGGVVVTAPAGDQPIVIQYVPDRLIQVDTILAAVRAATPLYRTMFPGWRLSTCSLTSLPRLTPAITR